jgi:predicted site-specific integrase-resolvase
VTVIVAEHRDRCGVEYAGAALSAPGCRVMVMDPAELDDGLVRGVTGILISLCSRLYGRGAADRAERAVTAVTGGMR